MHSTPLTLFQVAACNQLEKTQFCLGVLQLLHYLQKNASPYDFVQIRAQWAEP